MSDENPIALIEQYKLLVARYEALSQEIDDFLTAARRDGKALDPDEMQRYRAIARERDELFSEMRAMQRQLIEETTDIPKVPPPDGEKTS